MRRPLDATALRTAVTAADGPWLGVDVVADVDSTNAEMARRPRPWTVLCADHQSQGRGRLARMWQAPAYASVAVSVVVPADGPDPAMHGWLPLLTGMAATAAVRDVTSLAPRLKWPNDVLLPCGSGHGVAWHKVAGVLCELLPGALVVAGLGLNVDQSKGELPVPTATSLALSGAGPVARELLLSAYLERFAELHTMWRGGGASLDGLRDRYRSECLTIGQQVRVEQSGGSTAQGVARGVDDTGRLVVESSAGRTAYAAGDVVHLRPEPVR